jgi:hypothetical protein
VLRLLAQERFAAGSTDAALQAWARARAIDPNDTASLVQEAAHLQAAQRPLEALQRLQHALALDPREPQATLAAAAVLCQQGKTAAGIALLLRDPHPRLRAVLADNLAELERHARARGDAGAELLAIEHAWIAALDALALAPASLATRAAISRLNDLQAAAGARDLRPFALLAIYAIGIGESGTAAALARDAARKGALALAAPHRLLLGELAAPLRSIEDWRTLLERRD